MPPGHRYSIFRVVDNDLLALGHGSTPQTPLATNLFIPNAASVKVVLTLPLLLILFFIVFYESGIPKCSNVSLSL